MPPPGRGRGRGRGRGHPGPHRPHPHPQPHPHPKPAPVVHPKPHPHPGPHPHPVVAQPKPAPKKTFERLYHWGNHAVVVITHSLGKNLRVKPGDHSKLGFEGGTGELARWKCHIHENGASVQ